VLSAVLSGSAYADLVYPKDEDGKPLPANLGHFFGALKVDAFRPQAEFEASMDDLQARLKGANRVEGEERIWVAGEKEHDYHAQNSAEGLTLGAKVTADLRDLALQYGVPLG
jgi:L-2-hydroxycarboxylate dehydrogenase (NAD+)